MLTPETKRIRNDEGHSCSQAHAWRLSGRHRRQRARGDIVYYGPQAVPLTPEDEHYHLIDTYPATLRILALRQRFAEGMWDRVNALLGMPQRIIWEIVVLKDTGE